MMTLIYAGLLLFAAGFFFQNEWAIGLGMCLFTLPILWSSLRGFGLGLLVVASGMAIENEALTTFGAFLVVFGGWAYSVAANS